VLVGKFWNLQDKCGELLDILSYRPGLLKFTKPTLRLIYSILRIELILEIRHKFSPSIDSGRTSLDISIPTSLPKRCGVLQVSGCHLDLESMIHHVDTF
ncbi:hypothetical protein Tco_0521373, partial [Tanacetum coccineum]